MVIILMYVDDFLITNSNDQLITEVSEILHQQFKLKDLGSTGDSPLENVSAYQRLIGRLMYVTITRPNISYAIHTLSQFMQHPKKSHWEAALRVVRYLKNSPGQGIWLRSGPASELQCWCDSNWAACPNIRRSVTGYVVKFGESLISWKSNKQQTVSKSSAESKYRSMASAVAEVTRLLGLFQELGIPIKLPVLEQCASKSAIQLASNPIFHERTKHIEIDCHFIRDKIKEGVV
ncbi:secreted RxLR effector protein 161-like [Nicotiana tomentosiformis]|uniref:secreted RxLR effector protein 161-like n=1 Tax=Nicotiana tomentosiformis TaxID=4098 RepID=UPI0008782D25